MGKPVKLEDLNTLRSHAGRTRRSPCPNALHFFGGGKNLSSEVYPDHASFFDDTIEALRKMIRALADAGCS